MDDSSTSQPLDGIAVVGIAGRFPGSGNCDEFWQNLRAGREGLTLFTDEEIEASGYDLGSNRGKRVRSRGVVDNADWFDAAFFGYTPREAEIMDPQQRVFLELAWDALENAGFDPDRVPGAVGVYAGASINTYYPNNVGTRPDVLGPFGIFPAVALNEKDFLATRVAYKLNLRGPAISVQTACSTSLVAVCNACQSLLNYDCDIALAGGVAINYPHCHSIIHEDGGMISQDGHCKPFDKNATGTLFSDGAGVVALRRLEDAIESGDTILAVIKGYALNNDGSDKAGFTAPSITGQSEVIQMAQAFADFEPDTITYIEAHGTATRLGDPIEIAGLTQAFRTRTDANQFCALGSVKSNVGHLDVAAGIAGLIKTVLALHHKEIPPTIHFEEPNPQIDFTSTPFYVVDELREWIPPAGVPRRAGVSSFGIGGTNAHVVLEEAPNLDQSGDSRSHQLLLLSARTREAVDASTRNLAAHLSAHADFALADAAYTLQSGRYQFNHRRVVVCLDREDAIAKLGGDNTSEIPTLTPGRHNPPIVFMFPGQGAQRINMGRELYDNEPLYRSLVDNCSEILLPELNLDLRDVLFPATGKENWAEAQIVQTRITQPALFVTEYALTKLWMSWGVTPQYMIGHSVGEYVAACLAGVFSLEDGLRLIASRGRLIQEQPTGTMLAVMTGEANVRPLLCDGVSVATINSPTLCVVSGSHDDVATMEQIFADHKLEYRPLHTSHAFHSEMMEPVVAPFTDLLRSVQLNAPTLPFVSNLTAEWIKDDEAMDPAYWAQHLRQAVRFSDGAALLLDITEHQVMLEVGPGATLTSLTRMNPGKKPGHVVLPSLASAVPEQQSEVAIILSSMGRLWQAGVDIDWRGFYGAEKRRRVPLPCYPFERKRFFIEPGRVDLARLTAPAAPEAADAGDNLAQPEPKEALTGRDAIVLQLREILEALSGLAREEMSVNGHLLELGFDSLLLSRACSAIDAQFKIAITPRMIAEELPTIADIARHVESAVPNVRTDTDQAARSMVPESSSTDDLSLVVSDAQKEVWLASLIDDDVSRTYNEPRVVRIKGSLDSITLKNALQSIVDTYDALRATFSSDGSAQTIRREVSVELPIESVSGCTSRDETEDRLAVLLRAALTEVFDLENGPLFRFRLYDLGDNQWALLLVAHHAVADGWSWAVILDELGKTYTALASGNEPPKQARLPYPQYISWLTSQRQLARANADEKYWLELLSDKPEEVELPTDKPRPAQKTFSSRRVEHVFDPELVTRLHAVARKLDCTLFHLLTASFYAWLSRVTGKHDLVVAVPTAGQIAAGINELRNADRLVGHCVNMLPVRLQCAADQSFSQFLRHARTSLLDARDHQHVSFQNLITKLNWPRDPSRTPMASVSLNFANDHQVQIPGLEMKTELPEKIYNFFDLTIDMIHGDAALAIDCKFNVDLFEAVTIRRWMKQWEQLLNAITKDADSAIGDLEILDQTERQLLVDDWNATRVDYPRDDCLHTLVSAQALRSPGTPAVSSNDVTLTHGELDEKACLYAAVLRDKGIGRGSHVGICVERNAEMLAAVLGILKAGAAYVPLDPSFPDDRLRFMADDADLAMLVSTEELAGRFEVPREKLLLLDVDQVTVNSKTGKPLPVDSKLDARPEDPAYLIYTSGSTGQPKGVVVPHRAVINFLSSMARDPGLSAEDVLVAVTTLSFDISVLELFLPLIKGAHVVIASRDQVVDGEALKNLLDKYNGTLMQATPMTWRMLLEASWTGSVNFKSLVGGEPLPKDLAKQLCEQGVELWNMYGPTETTVWSTCARITSTSAGISIGKPINNTTIYIFDERKNICPVGVAGELYIGGDGVTHGYWKRPDLTADRFIDDPFGNSVSGKIYGTGDKARWLGNGTLEHLGRLDDQVKIRGFRIELGDIEAHIVKHPDIRESVVIAREYAPGDQRLVAYCTTSGTLDNLADQLRQHLLRTLPEYMVPAHYVALDELPRTQNGKLDRKSLPEFDFAESRQDVQLALPQSEAEKALAGIWKDVLKLDEVGVNENFFELGGHSLLAMQITSRIRDDLEAALPLRDFLSFPTIADQATKVEKLLAEPDSDSRGASVWKATERPEGLSGDREEFVL